MPNHEGGQLMSQDPASRQRILDAHIHWWDLEHNYYPWLMDKRDDSGESGLSGAGPIARTYVADHYLEDAAGYDIVGVVHIEAQWDPADPSAETRWLDRLADSGEDRGLLKAIVGFANLADANCEKLLEAHAACPRVRGIRHMLNRIEGEPELCWASEDFTQNPAWLENYALLRKYGLGFDLMCFSNMMHRMADLAHRHADTTIYVEHTGMPHQFDAAGIAAWRSGMKALAANPNVVCKLSGLGTTVKNWTEQSIRPFVLDAIDIFGIDRVMFATNFPTDKLFGPMDELIRAYLSITSGFTQSERDQIFVQNAVRHYRLTI
jgi:predicted TIM-barrel fold metal-dependent hydrolase